MKITTIPQLLELIATHEWRFTGERPSTFGLMRDFEAKDGSLIVLIDYRESHTAIAWQGPNVCPFTEILIDKALFPAILNSLMDNARNDPFKGQKFICRTIHIETPGKSTLVETEIRVNGKVFLVESLVSKTQNKGTYQWMHRTIGADFHHEWGCAHYGAYSEATRSHDEYLNSMKTIIERAGQ